MVFEPSVSVQSSTELSNTAPSINKAKSSFSVGGRAWLCRGSLQPGNITKSPKSGTATAATRWFSCGGRRNTAIQFSIVFLPGNTPLIGPLTLRAEADSLCRPFCTRSVRTGAACYMRTLVQLARNEPIQTHTRFSSLYRQHSMSLWRHSNHKFSTVFFQRNRLGNSFP